MSLITPKLVVLDTSTLGKVSRDFWSSEERKRTKSRAFVARLNDQSVYIALTLTNVLELLRHNDERCVRDRIAFLRALPFVAWLRPYDRHWSPGGFGDLLQRELHAFVHASKSDWETIIEFVRADLWETGCGSEMFENAFQWRLLGKVAQKHQMDEPYIVSIARTDPGQIQHMTIGEVRKWPQRSEDERAAFFSSFSSNLQRQLEEHCDRRLKSPQDTAIGFSAESFERVESIAARGGDSIDQILNHFNVPADFVTDEMTIADVGQLGVYVAQLKIFSRKLRPPVQVTICDVPPDTLPTYVLMQRLAAIQRKAPRVSGSDLGDGHIAPLALYTASVEVDKRTHEFLTQLKRADEALAKIMGRFFKSADYEDIPDQVCQID